MSFVLRAAFWLTVLAFLLPGAEDEGTSQTAALTGDIYRAAYHEGAPPPDHADIGAGEALALAARSAQDVMGFCGRNPEVCEKSHALAGHIVRQTTYYGSMAVVWIAEKARERQQNSTTTPSAGSHIAQPRAASGLTAGA